MKKNLLLLTFLFLAVQLFAKAPITYYSISEGEIKFTGDADQAIFGDAIFTDLTIENSNAVEVNSDITVLGTLELTDGDLITNGNNVTLESTSSETGILLETNGDVTGDITFERHIPFASGYHYISTPVSDAFMYDLDDDFTLNSLGGNTSSSPFPNIFTYDETNSSTNKQLGWEVPATISTPMKIGKGYATSIDENIVLDITGTPNKGEVIIPMTYTVSSDSSHTEICPPDGWNLIGNPYPSPIDWRLVSIDSTIYNSTYVWDPSYNQYATYINGVGVNGGNPIIAAFQGFFIRVDTNTTLTLNENVRVEGEANTIYFKSASDPIIKLKIHHKGRTDETAIYTNGSCTVNFDKFADAFKIPSDNPHYPQIASSSEGNVYAINGMPAFDAKETIIPIVVIPGTDGTHKIEANEIKGFEANDVVLHDAVENIFTDLKTASYSFEMLDTDTTQRFFVHIGNVITKLADVISEDETVNIYEHDNTVYIYFEEITPVTIKLIDASGKAVYHKRFNNKTNIAIPFGHITSGIYFIELSTNTNRTVRKVVF